MPRHDDLSFFIFSFKKRFSWYFKNKCINKQIKKWIRPTLSYLESKKPKGIRSELTYDW